jgi:hypothetical protein
MTANRLGKSAERGAGCEGTRARPADHRTPCSPTDFPTSSRDLTELVHEMLFDNRLQSSGMNC